MKNNQGFTLVETLVAVTVLVIGVLGPLAMAARGISDGLFAQNQLTANMLAQEAMEVIINYRNGNVLDGRPAFEGINSGGTNATIDIDGSQDAVIPNGCSTSVDLDDDDQDDGCLLAYDETAGYYKTVTAGGGQFARQIVTTPISVQELKVAVKITWKNRDIPKRLDIVEYLYAD